MATVNSKSDSIPSDEVLAHVVDVHCHPTDSTIPPRTMELLPIKICVMATKENDQQLVRNLALLWPNKVVPAFGYHPWFTHWISLEPSGSKEQHYRALLLDASRPRGDNVMESFEKLLPHLPEPIMLSDILATLRSNLTEFPNAMLGEVGLDRSFRIPFKPNSGSERKLSDITVPLDHQMHVLEAQLELAVELRRNVSLHSVKAQQATLQLIDRMARRHGEAWDMISIDMHSCGLSPEVWMTLEKNYSNTYLSLSTTINARSRSLRTLIAACASDRILAESDYHDVRGLTGRTWEIITTIAEVKGWQVETQWQPSSVTEEHWGVVRRLEENWKAFSCGAHVERRRKLEARKRNRKDRKNICWDDDENN